MTLTYFFMLLFVFWCVFLLTSLMWPDSIYESIRREQYWAKRIVRCIFAVFATWFFHQVW